MSNFVTEDDKSIVEKLIMGVDVTEVYSPESGALACRKMGMTAGSPMDLTTGYDFEKV